MEDKVKYCNSEDPCNYRGHPKDNKPYEYPCLSPKFCSAQRANTKPTQKLEIISDEEIKTAWQAAWDKDINSTREERLRAIAQAQLSADEKAVSGLIEQKDKETTRMVLRAEEAGAKVCEAMVKQARQDTAREIFKELKEPCPVRRDGTIKADCVPCMETLKAKYQE